MLLAEPFDAPHAFHFAAQLITSGVTLLVLWKVMRLIRRAESEWERQHVRRTPLATIHGMVQTLRANPDMDEAQRERVFAVIEKESARGLDAFRAETESGRNGTRERS